MAQKKRGLGRGLQALIPEAQTEDPVRRPSDVFFPAAAKDSEDAQQVSSEASEAASKKAAAITSALLAPSKRKKTPRRTSKASTGEKDQEKAASAAGASRRSTRSAVGSGSAGRRSGGRAKAAATADVSRETSPASKVLPSVEEVVSEPVVPEIVPEAAPEPVAPAGNVKQSVSSVRSADFVAEDTAVAGDEQPAPAASSDNSREEASGVEVSSPQELVSSRDKSSVEEISPQDEGNEGDVPDEVTVSRETSPDDSEASDDASELVPVPGATFAELPVGLIVPNPRQPRQNFDEDEIAELADSIKEVGLLQPIVVRRIDDESGEAEHYELIMGERRLRASRVAGLDTIPAIVRYTEDQDLLRDALLENLHRVQLNPLEEAAAYQQLLEDFHCTHQELSKRIARSRSQISNTLRLMKLPPLVQRRLAAGVVSAGHARALLGLPDAAAMERLAQKIVAEGLSVRATEELVALHEEPEENRPARPLRARSTALPALSTRLSDAFDTRVKVTRGAKKGRITIEFAGEDDLARIVETLAPGTSLLED